jgi:hypothetical protein
VKIQPITAGLTITVLIFQRHTLDDVLPGSIKVGQPILENTSEGGRNGILAYYTSVFESKETLVATVIRRGCPPYVIDTVSWHCHVVL